MSINETNGNLTFLFLSQTLTFGSSQNSRRPARHDACIIIQAKFQVISVILREAGLSFDSRLRSPSKFVEDGISTNPKSKDVSMVSIPFHLTYRT